MILFIFLFVIITEAIYEALKLREKNIASGIIEFVHRAFVVVLLSMFMAGWHWDIRNDGLFYVIGSYVLLRFAVFDVAYNLTAGLPLFYIGSTKLYDLAWKRFFEITRFPEGHFLWMIKLIALLISLTWLT